MQPSEQSSPVGRDILRPVQPRMNRAQRRHALREAFRKDRLNAAKARRTAQRAFERGHGDKPAPRRFVSKTFRSYAGRYTHVLTALVTDSNLAALANRRPA